MTLDMNQDTVPDICDSDIDWDNLQNQLGLIRYENVDCSLQYNQHKSSDIYRCMMG